MTLSQRWPISVLVCILLSGAASGSEKAVKSSFTASKIPRDPFVRIDASHLANKAQVVFESEEDESAPGKLFRVTGISMASLAIALINGKAFAEKDTFTVKARDKELRVTLLKVNEGGVELEFGGKIVSVPMVREALSSDDESE